MGQVEMIGWNCTSTFSTPSTGAADLSPDPRRHPRRTPEAWRPPAADARVGPAPRCLAQHRRPRVRVARRRGTARGRGGAGTFVEAIRWRTRRTGAPPAGGVWSTSPDPARRRPPPTTSASACPTRPFPFDAWRRLLARQLRAALGAGYGDPAGHPRLRAAIARHVGVARGVRRRGGCGRHERRAAAFDLIARVLLEPGARVAVEDPGYPPARQLFESCGARVAAVPVDDEGLTLVALPTMRASSTSRPRTSFPLACRFARAPALLDWAERRNAVIIEDDYDSEFRFGGRPLETLQASTARARRLRRLLLQGDAARAAPRLSGRAASLRKIMRAANLVAGWHAPLPAGGAGVVHGKGAVRAPPAQGPAGVRRAARPNPADAGTRLLPLARASPVGHGDAPSSPLAFRFGGVRL